jgi:hypothetical protein
MRRTAALLAALALLALAAAVRLPNLTAGYPYINYVDEGNLLHPVVPMLCDGGWDPRDYMYPSLPLNAAAAAVRLYEPFHRAAHGGRSLIADLRPRGGEYDLISSHLLLAARAENLLVALGIVALAGLLARRLAGARAGWAAALLTALVPALAIRGAVAMVDPWAALFVLACFLGAERLRTADRPGREALWTGAMAGFAFAAKYPAVLAGLAPAWIVLRSGRPWRDKLRLLLALAAGAAAAAVAAMPGLALHPREVWTALQYQRELYGKLPTAAPLWRQAFVRAEWDLPYEHPEIGVVFLLAALGGLALALRDRELATTAQAWTLYAVPTVVLFSIQSFQPFRNLLPLVAPACILAALLWDRLRRRLAHPLWADAVALALLAVLFVHPLAGYARERWALRDSRTEAIDWLAPRMRADDRVLVLRELQIQPAELARLPGRVVLRPWPGVRKALFKRVRFLVASKPHGPGKALWSALLQAYEVRARFGEDPTPQDPGWWHGNRQTVYLLEQRELDARR